MQFLTFKVNFLCQKLSESFSIFFSLKSINLGADFLITSIFKSLYFLKWRPIFDTFPLIQFNNFLWVCWFLGKNLSNFVPPVWKLHNPYCNNVHWVETFKIWTSFIIFMHQCFNNHRNNLRNLKSIFEVTTYLKRRLYFSA